MESTTFSFRLDRDQKEILEQAAKDMGLTFTELLRTGATFFANLHPVLRSKIRDFRERMGGDISESRILENIALSWFAQFAALEDAGIPTILTEFQFSDRGFLKGENLFNVLKEEYKGLLDRDPARALILRARYGAPLSDEEKFFIIEYADSLKMETAASSTKKKRMPTPKK